jgi:hypothetical protein
MGGSGVFIAEAFSRSMNASNSLIEQGNASTARGTVAPAMNDARDSAHRALFSAASRVLSHHAAALDAKVARIMQAQPEDGLPDADSSLANG